MWPKPGAKEIQSTDTKKEPGSKVFSYLREKIRLIMGYINLKYILERMYKKKAKPNLRSPFSD